MLPNLAVIVTDAQRNIQWVNDGFTLLTGYTLQEVIGKKPNILQGPGSEREVIRRIRKGLEAQIPFKDQITNYRKNGEAYQCRLVIHPIFNNNKELTNFIAFEIDADIDGDKPIPLLEVNAKYRTSSLKGAEGAKLYYSLKALLERELLYLDPNVNLRTLADKLGTNTKYLSQVVNFHFGNNLQVFINTFRIEEAKKKMLKSEFAHLTLYGIAMQCGFKNKSTFYKVFKQQTGMTPLDYVRKHENS